ncbi:hypothetical protein [Cryobacterium soli]|uniref:hypothetical protein n=1 Tax=Cryobacterium soli TaxID=2220095 RepID=UPI000E7186F0|nr:hypothetical protein [Cryobacterium soli]
MRINRLGGDDKFAQILREVRQVQQAAMLNKTSVTNGQTRFAGNESLLVEGSQKVSGWLIVTGILKVVGTFLLEGATTITGAFALKGPATFEGDIAQTGTNVINTPGKLVLAGTNPMTLGIGAFGQPGATFGSGGGLTGYAGGALLHGGAALVGCTVTTTIAQLSSGTNYLSVGPTKSSFNGPLEATSATVNFTNLPTTTVSGLPAGVVVINSSTGKLSRTI